MGYGAEGLGAAYSGLAKDEGNPKVSIGIDTEHLIRPLGLDSASNVSFDISMPWPTRSSHHHPPPLDVKMDGPGQASCPGR